MTSKYEAGGATWIVFTATITKETKTMVAREN